MKFNAKDISASIVVFLVALPLCLGIAHASGVPVINGLIAGIVGGEFGSACDSDTVNNLFYFIKDRSETK